MADSERWMAAQNIGRFEEKLRTETEPAKRDVLRRLVERERRRLQAN